VLLIVTVTGLNAIVPGVPVRLVFALLTPAVLGLAVAVVYMYPPRWILPQYVRWLDGDAGFTERPACLDIYKDSRLNRVMRTLTLDPRQGY
jgi:hypothetical protein